MNLILLAPSGGGKGTLADYIKKDYQITHISTGEIIRDNIAKKTDLGVQVERYSIEGRFVPDDIVVQMLVDRLKNDDAQNGVILDGYPRSATQAQALVGRVSVDLVIELRVADEVILDRLSGRYVCVACNKNHNTKLGPVEKCRACGNKLYQREDDKVELIKRRLQQYHAVVEELTGYYAEQGKLCSIDVSADMHPAEVYEIAKKYLEECKDCEVEGKRK